MEVRYIILIAVLLVTLPLLVLFRRWLIKRVNSKPDKIINLNIIRQPKFYLYVGIGGIIIFLALGLFFILAPESMIADYESGMRLPVFFTFLILCFPYIIIILFEINWKIELGKNEFSFTNMWNRKRIYKYDEVEIRQLSRSTRFYHNSKHIVTISYLQGNWDALEKAMNKSRQTK